MTRTILIVDDEPTLTWVLSEQLKIRGFIPIASHSGAEALSILQKEKIDLVISDIRMPQMDGLELLKRAKQIGPYIPFIFVTGDSPRTREESYKEGAKGHFSKPYSITLLTQRITDILGDMKIKTTYLDRMSHQKKAQLFVAEDRVEDQILLTKAISGQIWKERLEITFYKSGDLLVESVMHGSIPDLFIIDLNMPGMSGPEVISCLRSEEKLSQVPIIVLTTSIREEDIKKSYELGADSFLVKPWTPIAWDHLAYSLGESWLPFLKDGSHT